MGFEPMDPSYGVSDLANLRNRPLCQSSILMLIGVHEGIRTLSTTVTVSDANHYITRTPMSTKLIGTIPHC